jgi:hypothetical protein
MAEPVLDPRAGDHGGDALGSATGPADTAAYLRHAVDERPQLGGCRR